MGTNYYAREKICKECGCAKKETHIGKSSFGWTFSFCATDEIRSFKEWVAFLKQDGIKICDEYGEDISLKDFIKLVNSKKNEKHNHAKEYPEGSFLDPEGNSMSEGEFS